jgi:microcystin-dependent protein
MNVNVRINSGFKGTKNNPTEKIRKIERHIYNMNLDIGDFKWSAKDTDFNGWLLCDGRSLSRTAYFELFQAIGTSFGSNNSTTFKIPDMRGRVIGGVGNSGNEDDDTHALGDSVGTENVTLSTDQIPSHSHTGTSNASSTGITSSGTTNNSTTGVTVNSVSGHTHTYQDAYFAENIGNGAGNFGTNADTDGDNAFIWRTAEGGNSNTPQNINTGTSGSHDHGITDTGHTHTFTANISDPTHTHTFTTQNTGGGESHPNLQPTLYAGNMFIYAKFTPEIII